MLTLVYDAAALIAYKRARLARRDAGALADVPQHARCVCDVCGTLLAVPPALDAARDRARAAGWRLTVTAPDEFTVACAAHPAAPDAVADVAPAADAAPVADDAPPAPRADVGLAADGASHAGDTTAPDATNTAVPTDDEAEHAADAATHGTD